VKILLLEGERILSGGDNPRGEYSQGRILPGESYF